MYDIFPFVMSPVRLETTNIKNEAITTVFFSSFFINLHKVCSNVPYESV